MTLPHPRYCPISELPADGVLAAVVFGSTPPPRDYLTVEVPIPQLGDPQAEMWLTRGQVRRESRHGVELSCTDELLFGTIRMDGPAHEIASRAYDRIVDACREMGYVNIWRIWNHVGGINAQEDGLERYKRFSSGRHDALTRHGYARERFPAASAVGMSEPGLLIYFIAGRTPGVQTENPRQISAYDYPAQYGPRSPSFSRATVVGGELVFISGTASVVGHASVHGDSALKQLDETVANLDATLATAAERVGRTASVHDLTVAKIYIRGSVDAHALESRLRETFPSAILLQSDICRRELLLEIEGVAVLSR